MDYDFIIVGGGSAGCVLARRLSDRSANRVLLCEAGRDLTDETMPEDIRASYPGRAYVNPDNVWPGLTIRSTGRGGDNASRADDSGVRRPYAQARILGGGSSINGQMANWGTPDDYEEWDRLGAAGWDWEGVAPYFQKLERDLDFPGKGHGADGPMALRRIFPEQWNGHALAVGKALEGLGYPYLEDQNGDFGEGWFPLVHANEDEARVTAATAYLDPETRKRPNLTVLTETQVTALIFTDGACAGVRLMERGQERDVSGHEVILSAGAIHSPAMLLRAGIGPRETLFRHGIAARHILPGVGRNLMDHPQIALGSWLRPASRMDGRTGRHVLMGLRYSSQAEGAPQGDMFMGCVSRTAWHAVGSQLGALTVWVNKTFSRDGEVFLRSSDWRDAPEVDFRLLSDARDMERLKAGFRLMARVYETEAMRQVAEMPFPASYTDRARQVGAETTRNRILSATMARLLDGPAPLRRALIRKFVMAKHDLESCLNDDSALEGFIREAVAGIWHASCTCRMGAAGDPQAVTDAEGRVHGVPGLRVCDASIFPSVPSANTNIPTMMAAEKVAAAILA